MSGQLTLDDSTSSASVPTHTPGADSTPLRKNGAVSNIRSHKGNIPTLPQTKFCHLCTAKFTRTTHLNRHLKTHSNERVHECGRCHAQFTRSDLLTRHKRTCFDSTTNRSRRKSCQSCADSKVRCDLQRPCSKCKARNRECIYLNVPAAITEVTEGTQVDLPAPQSAEDSSSSPSSSSHKDSPPTTDPSSQSSSDTATTVADLPTPVDASDVSFSLFASSSTAPADTLLDASALALSTDPQNAEETSYLAELFSSEMYDNLFSNVFTSSFQKNPAMPGQHFQSDPTSALTDRLEFAVIDPALGGPAFYETPAQIAIYPAVSSPSPCSRAAAATIPESELAGLSQATGLIHVQMPSVTEFYDYITLFMTTFLYHMPVIHLPTFLAEKRVYSLVKATKACGAMYANTTIGTKYVDWVLSTTRDEIIAQLSNTTDYDTIIQLTLASALLQTIGMFHRNAEERAKSNVYHGMIVMMLRMNGFVDTTRDWKMPDIDFSDPASIQTAWREWVRHESAKRALWICYLHDCCHAIYFNLSPTFHTEHFTLGLPTEDALWSAPNAMEWASILQTPSPYGTIEVRLCGHYLKALYYYLAQGSKDNSPRPFNINPFAHFILIHAMMRKLFEMYLRDRLPHHQPESARPAADSGAGAGTGAQQTKLGAHFVNKDRLFHVQILSHYWLQSWLESPETPRGVPETQQRFCSNALPYYWLVQVGLVAYQAGLPPFDPDGAYITSHEAKFNLIKKWEKHIRRFLESGEQAPTKFWDEVMKIRIESWQAESGFEFAHLLGFFNALPGQPAQSGFGPA